MKNILSINADSKTSKGVKKGFLTGILYLAPSDISGHDVCPMAKHAQCREACLYTAGRGKFSNVQKARIHKTHRFIYEREYFMIDLEYSIRALIRKAEREGLTPLVRLNGTSDIVWENIIFKKYGCNIFEVFPDVQFYDYTKDPERVELPNYHLTFSYSQASKARVNHYKQAIQRGQSIAFPVIASEFEQACALPDCYSMDETDLRFLDNAGKYGILKAKMTENLKEGVKNKFLLSVNDLKKVIELIES